MEPTLVKNTVKVTVLGMGNLLLKDEGIGVHIVRALEKVTVPGPFEAGIVKDRLENGIPLDPKVIEDLQTLAEELEMDFDLTEKGT